jgi:hypothetical protein
MELQGFRLPHARLATEDQAPQPKKFLKVLGAIRGPESKDVVPVLEEPFTGGIPLRLPVQWEPKTLPRDEAISMEFEGLIWSALQEGFKPENRKRRGYFPS